jgi:GNAT superfamily N-acetyltransferase
MLEPYLPEHFDAVAAFARSQPEFDYLKTVIRVHDDTKGKSLLPGKVWVWTLRRRVVAVCGLAYTTCRDAWLYGMRVDDRCRGKGVATAFTRALFGVARKAGCNWLGLDTMNAPHKAPVFRVTEKLGMSLEAIHSTFVLKQRTGQLGTRGHCRLGCVPQTGIYRYLRASGEKVTMRQDAMLWRWFRLRPELSRSINQSGCLANGVPVHIAMDKFLRCLPASGADDRPFKNSLAVNLFCPASDYPRVLPALLTRGHCRFGCVPLCKASHVVFVFPTAGQQKFLFAVRRVLPGLRRKRDYWLDSWRIYGKRL